LYDRLGLRCTGMEFASEMIIKATLGNAHTAEVPITLHQDGRTTHPPHLKTFRDGWRHLRFYLMYSPRWLFLLPGAGLMLLGALMMLGGVALLAAAVGQWWSRHFGALDVEQTMRSVIPGMTLTALGVQTVLSCFFLSILGLRRR